MSSLGLQKPRAKKDKNLMLELKIISATDLSHTHVDDKDNIDVYAVVSINSDHIEKKQAAKTPIDYDGGSNPTWNHTVKFSINEKAADEGLLTVKVKLLSFWLEAENDLYLGEVNVSVQELLASNPLPPFTNGNGNKMKSMTCPIKIIGGGTKARLSLSYRFNDMYPSAPDSLSYKPPSPVDDTYPSAPDISLFFYQPLYVDPDPPGPGLPIMHSPQHQSPMMNLTLEILIKCARDIKDVVRISSDLSSLLGYRMRHGVYPSDVNTFSAMDVYATVLILVDKTVQHGINTPVAFSAYTNPTWNHQAMVFPIDVQLAQQGRLLLLVKLISLRSSLGDKEIGRVKVPMHELLGLNPPSPLTNGDANVMKLVTHEVSGTYGAKGYLSFSYRFLVPQATLLSPSAPPSTTTKPFVTHLSVSHQSNESYGMVDGNPSYYHVPPPPRDKAGPSHGQRPISMPLPPRYQSQGNQQYSQSQPQQTLPQRQPRMQSERPVVKPQGSSLAGLGVGAAVLGRAIGGAFMSDMIGSDEANIYEVGDFGSIYSESIV
ncbi:hypothetical protein Bca4012_065993 [Brassica carinata]|uniref:C2 domain-containing protein n=1 Tax=Brassica carinata TaxID=52824 RepID=A0A8X8AYF4_BRACI|nr:hypothetical protein Bca52824_018310 [Brassica carinata]